MKRQSWSFRLRSRKIPLLFGEKSLKTVCFERMNMKIGVCKLAMAAPNDVSQLEKLIDSREIDPAEIVAVIGKTEGNGGANDFTRGFATLSYQLLLANRLGASPAEIGRRIAFVWSGGAEGVLSPHATLFTRPPAAPAGGKRLAIGIAVTRDFAPEEVGTMSEIREVADAVNVRRRRRASRTLGMAQSTLVDMRLQPGGEAVEHGAAARRRAQVFVHRQPDAELESEGVWQHALEVAIPARQRCLADADAEAGLDRHQLRGIAVGAQGEAEPVQGGRSLEHAADSRRLTVEPDQAVRPEIFHIARRAGAR